MVGSFPVLPCFIPASPGIFSAFTTKFSMRYCTSTKPERPAHALAIKAFSTTHEDEPAVSTGLSVVVRGRGLWARAQSGVWFDTTGLL